MKILILSRNSLLYSTQSLYNAATRRGHDVQVCDHLMCNIVIEKNAPQLYLGADKLDQIDAVIPRIGASATEYGASVIRQFESMGIFTTVTSEALLKARNKLHSMQILSTHGYDIPKTALCGGDLFAGQTYDHISEDRAVVKLLSSTQGLGVILAQSKNQGISLIEGFHRVGHDVMIQEYISDAKGSDIRAFVVNGRIVGSMLRQALPGEFRSNVHRGASTEIVQLTKAESDMAIKATKLLGLSIAGVDLLRSSRGPLILEVNASPGLEGIEGTTKKDIAGTIIKFIEDSHSKKKKT
jgi:ribosomal protein S6--L-glutamate ligase